MYNNNVPRIRKKKRVAAYPEKVTATQHTRSCFLILSDIAKKGKIGERKCLTIMK